jgi:hypothetical protein
MVLGALACGEAWNAKIVLVTGGVRTRYPDLNTQHISVKAHKTRDEARTVEVMSTEQTSQWYFVPPSVPRAAVFFRITPMDRSILSSSALSESVSDNTE